MEDLSIYTLVMSIRGFSNAVTVKGLAERLGVSYPTLARCKSGKWPRSITLDAMRNTFEECRERFFDGDGEAMAHSLLMQLADKSHDTEAFEEILDEQGYDAFMSALIIAAKHRRPVADGSAAPEPAPEEPPALAVADSPTQASSAKINLIVHNLAMMAPVAFLLALGMTRAPLSSMISWANAHRLAFFGISAAIAVVPAIVGILIDSPLAWRRWRRTHPNAKPAARDLALIAKFGDTERLVPLEGRFNLTPSYLAYQPVCNLLSMMSYVSLLAFLLTLPGFVEFFASYEWAEFFKVGAVVAYYIAYQFMREQYDRPFVGEFGLGICENPDNYLPSRFHMWANVVHLVWTGSVFIVLLLGLISYTISNTGKMEMPLLILWPYVQLMAYFFFSSASPYAVRIRAKGAGVLLPGVVVASVGYVALVLACYIPSPASAAFCAVCAACTALAFAWVGRVRGGEMADWLDQTRASAVYPVIIIATLALLLVVGAVTLAFAY